MAIQLGTTKAPIACAWLGRMSDALSVTMRTCGRFGVGLL
jgi:hypothetical protein